ncbi:MAG: hypothetical protein FJ220_04620, partial [Kiritimatiellaceae bacterium]|nr:hypothetical protein [Kiritimatiellaceae bacterium]
MAVMPYVPTTVDPFLEPWRWRYEESLDGLSAVCMDEADDGTLWFGNIGSIARYDGVSVKTIPFDQKLLSQTTQDQAVPWAKALVVLPDGRPLVLVGETLVVWEKGSWRVILRDVGPSVFSAQFVQAEGGVIWFLAPKALWQISPDLQEISVVIQAEDGGRMESLSPDDDGKLWVLEKKANLTSRLVRIPLVNGRAIASADWAEFPVPFKNEDTEARIAVGLDGIIWYADSSVRSGLETFDPKTGVWTSAKGLTSPRYHSLIRLSNGSIIAGENGQIVVASRLGSEQIYMSEQLSLPKLTFSFFEASNQRLWMIGRIGYVYSIDLGDREWQTFAELNYQCEALDGSLWFLTKKAENAIRYDPKSGSCVQYEQAEGLLGKPYALFQTRDGLIWVAGRQGRCAAVSLFNGKSWTTTIFTNFANWIEPRAVLEAADGTVWLGAGGVQHEDFTGGLLQLTVDENQHLRVIKNHAPPQVPYYVTAITQTPDQTLWLGSTVVYRYDGISPAVPLPDLQGENTESMVLDRQNSLWVTKEHVGVGRWTNDAWDIFALEEGMASRRASGLLLLEDGSLLASSAQGMSRFDGVSWIPGVFPDWFAMNSRWSSMRQSKDGSLWFSYGWLEASPKWMISNDTTFYRTVRHRLETEPPETQITEHLRRVSQPGNVHVVWTGKDPWSRTPRKELYYSWRLDQGEWSPYSRETGQTFLSLEDGHHQLEVRARDRSFNVDPTPARIEFTVVPPVWKQLWFISLISFLVGLIALMVWIMILNRERYLKAQQTEREAFLVRQQADRERYLMERQQEHEAQLV